MFPLNIEKKRIGGGYSGDRAASWAHREEMMENQTPKLITPQTTRTRMRCSSVIKLLNSYNLKSSLIRIAGFAYHHLIFLLISILGVCSRYSMVILLPPLLSALLGTVMSRMPSLNLARTPSWSTAAGKAKTRENSP